jgi:hypothetical protein
MVQLCAVLLLCFCSVQQLHKIKFHLGSKEKVPMTIETSFADAMGAAMSFCERYQVKDLACAEKIYRMILDRAADLHESSRSKRSLILALRDQTAEQDARKFCAANELSTVLCSELVSQLPHFLAHRKQQCKRLKNSSNIVFSTVPKSGTSITLLLLNSISEALGIDAAYPSDELIASERMRTGKKSEQMSVIKTHFPFQSVCRGSYNPSCIIRE